MERINFWICYLKVATRIPALLKPGFATTIAISRRCALVFPKSETRLLLGISAMLSPCARAASNPVHAFESPNALSGLRDRSAAARTGEIATPERRFGDRLCRDQHLTRCGYAGKMLKGA